MLAIQRGIKKYHCPFLQGASAFQTPGVASYLSGLAVTQHHSTSNESSRAAEGFLK